MADCPKCRGRMTQGHVYLPDTGGRVKWRDGEPGWKAALGMGGKSSDLLARRCTECGFVEFYADTSAKPVKTLRSIDEENERLKRELDYAKLLLEIQKKASEILGIPLKSRDDDGSDS